MFNCPFSPGQLIRITTSLAECHYNGTSYKSGTEWTDPDDPCLNYKCLAGVVTQVNLQCYTPCQRPQHPLADSGQCCPTCAGESNLTLTPGSITLTKISLQDANITDKRCSRDVRCRRVRIPVSSVNARRVGWSAPKRRVQCCIVRCPSRSSCRASVVPGAASTAKRPSRSVASVSWARSSTTTGPNSPPTTAPTACVTTALCIVAAKPVQCWSVPLSCRAIPRQMRVAKSVRRWRSLRRSVCTTRKRISTTRPGIWTAADPVGVSTAGRTVPR